MWCYEDGVVYCCKEEHRSVIHEYLRARDSVPPSICAGGCRWPVFFRGGQRVTAPPFFAHVRGNKKGSKAGRSSLNCVAWHDDNFDVELL